MLLQAENEKRLPRRLDGESLEQSVIRKVRSSGPDMSLWLRGLAPLPLSVTPSVPTSAYVPGTSKAPVPSGAEAGAVPPVGLEPTTFGLKVRSSDQLS